MSEQAAHAPSASTAGGATPGRVAVAQLTSTADTSENFATIARLAQEAAAAGACMLFLPENFNFLGRSPAESLAVAEPLSGATMARYRELARSLGLWLSLGGFQEVGPDPEHLHNCHVIVDAAGEIRAKYRKVHLFDVDVPRGPVLMESRFTAPGREVRAGGGRELELPLWPLLSP